MKSILIKTTNEEQVKLVEAFIKKHKLDGFIVEDSKATETDFLNDLIRLLIPIA